MLFAEISLASLFALAASILFISYISYNYFFHPLSRLPGPLICHLGLPSFMYSRVYHRDVVWGLMKAHKKYGKNGELAPMIRIGANGISVADPEIASEVYSVSNRLQKTQFYEGLTSDQRPPGPNAMFFETDNKFHAILRKQSHHSYSPNALADVSEFITPQIELLVSQLSKITRTEGKVDLSKWLGFFAFDAVTDLAFGKSFGCLKGGGDGGVGKINENYWRRSLLLGTQTWLIPLSRFRDRVFGLTPAVFGLFDLARPIVEGRVKELERGESPRPDLLTKFIQGRDATATSERSMYHILISASEVLGAGSDTTANFLRGFFQLVLSDPRVYQALKKEIREAEDEGRLTHPATQAQGASLPYLQLCILETQRFAPVVGIPPPREVPVGGMKFGGVQIPAGTSIGSAAWLVHRNKALYGDDAEVFRPERWSEVDKETKDKMERSLQFFGAGTRICAGRFISQMEYQRLLPTLLMNFDFSIIARNSSSPHADAVGTNISTGEKDINAPSTIISWWFNEWSDFWVQISERKRI